MSTGHEIQSQPICSGAFVFHIYATQDSFQFLYHPSNSTKIETHNILRSIVELLLGSGGDNIIWSTAFGTEDSQFTSRTRRPLQYPSDSARGCFYVLFFTHLVPPHAITVLNACHVFIHAYRMCYCQECAFKVDGTGVERRWNNVLDKPVIRTKINT
jgi:hypothetical protein